MDSSRIPYIVTRTLQRFLSTRYAAAPHSRRAKLPSSARNGFKMLLQPLQLRITSNIRMVIEFRVWGLRSVM